MVQKKVHILQTDDVKFNKLLKNLKPSSFQHQESMNRGTDMMKIMKKQRQNLCNSSSFRKQISQPGKPPPPSMASSSSSKMQSLIKISEKKPNYMKPTTSSDARKENSQPNFKNLETSSKKNGKSPSALTKTTSFKPTRSATGSKKSYPFVENVLKPTCSSTLKDSKFPVFLTLNSGGTESEGTSLMKVCSYTYCSLNGHHHHHPPLPPLKSFLSARRHMLKTQRSIKMGSLSPRQLAENKDVIKENETLQVNFQEEYSNEEDEEFFIQIYSKESEAGGDRVETVKELEIDHQKSCNGNNDTNYSDIDWADYSLEDNNNESVVGEMGDIQAISPLDSDIETDGHATLYLDDHKVVEIENKYFEELKLDKTVEESVDEETITGSDTDSDQDFQIDETVEDSNMKSDEELEDVLKENCAVDDHYQPSDPKSETEDDNQDIQKDGAIGDYYPPSGLESESKNDNQELQKQSSIADHYQPSDRKSENEDDNQELQKDSPNGSIYQLSESDCINLPKTDESIALSPDSQSDLTKKICPALKKMHTIDIDEDVSKISKIGKWIYKQKESNSEENELKGFNPRGPNFLEVEPGPESEKVDLKHQMIDDRRNSEEWMLDYALQQAVNKLAVARKKKVTLLVEAFETVSPLPKWEKTRMGVGFDLQHRIQACR